MNENPYRPPQPLPETPPPETTEEPEHWMQPHLRDMEKTMHNVHSLWMSATNNSDMPPENIRQLDTYCGVQIGIVQTRCKHLLHSIACKKSEPETPAVQRRLQRIQQRIADIRQQMHPDLL